MFRVVDKNTRQRLTVYAVERLGDETLFLVCLNGHWTWLPMNRFRPEKEE